MTISEDLPNQLLVAEVEAPPLTLANLTWRRFRRHKMAIFGAVVLVLLTLYSFGGAFFFTEKYSNFTNTKERLQPPSAAHPFGTDTVGRDILARTIYGGQISIAIGITAAFVEVIIGILIGAIAGYFGGRMDRRKGTDSKFFLKEVTRMIAAQGWKVENVDCSVTLEAPKVKPHIEAMKKAIAPLMNIGEQEVSIKANTNEKLGYVGRMEGVHAYAVVLISRS